MDVWVTWCKRQAACRYCPEQIVKGSPMIVTSEWRKRPNSDNPLAPAEVTVRRWKSKYYWHFDCWIENAKQWLDNHPYKNTTKRGGKPKAITPEDKKARFNILVRRAKLAARLREAIGVWDFEAMDDILTKMEALKEEIRPLGGVPTSWDRNLKGGDSGSMAV